MSASLRASRRVEISSPASPPPLTTALVYYSRRRGRKRRVLITVDVAIGIHSVGVAIRAMLSILRGVRHTRIPTYAGGLHPDTQRYAQSSLSCGGRLQVDL